MKNDAYSKYYAHERLSMDKARVIFKPYLHKKHKRFGIRIYKLCYKTGYTCDMGVCLGKDRTRATADMTATHATVKCLTRQMEGYGHKLCMDNIFCPPDLFHDMTKHKINCCGTVRQTLKINVTCVYRQMCTIHCQQKVTL